MTISSPNPSTERHDRAEAEILQIYSDPEFVVSSLEIIARAQVQVQLGRGLTPDVQG